MQHADINKPAGCISYMQAAVPLHVEPHLKGSIAEGSKSEAKRADVPETPQSTGVAVVRTLGRIPDAIVTFPTVLVCSLHDSMSSFDCLQQKPVHLCLYLSAHAKRADYQAPHQALGHRSMHNLLTSTSPPKRKSDHSSHGNT